MRVHHIAHAAVLLEMGGTRVLLDPGTFGGWHGLRDLDAVVITHDHPDHLDSDHLPDLLAANPAARVLAEPGVADALTAQGMPVAALAPGQSAQIGAVTLTGSGGQHATIHPDIPHIGNIGVTVSADGEPAFFHPGDSHDPPPGSVDVLAVPLSAPWTALAQTVDFVRAVAPRIAFPIHDGMLNDTGRQLYLRLLGDLGGTDVRDLAGAGDVEIES